MDRFGQQAPPGTFSTSFTPSTQTASNAQPAQDTLSQNDMPLHYTELYPSADVRIAQNSTGKGVLIGMLSAFGSAAVVAFILLIIYFFQYTQRGRIFLDRLGRPGEFDDEQAFAREEAEALEEMDDMQRAEYLRAKGKGS